MRKYDYLLNGEVLKLQDDENGTVVVLNKTCSKCGESLRLTEVIDGMLECDDCN